MILKAITYNYLQDGHYENKVVGIFAPEQLLGVIQEIREGFGKGRKEKKYRFDQPSNNFFLEYNDDQGSYFYSGDYTLGELKL